MSPSVRYRSRCRRRVPPRVRRGRPGRSSRRIRRRAPAGHPGGLAILGRRSEGVLDVFRERRAGRVRVSAEACAQAGRLLSGLQGDDDVIEHGQPAPVHDDLVGAHHDGLRAEQGAKRRLFSDVIGQSTLLVAGDAVWPGTGGSQTSQNGLKVRASRADNPVAAVGRWCPSGHPCDSGKRLLTCENTLVWFLASHQGVV